MPAAIGWCNAKRLVDSGKVVMDKVQRDRHRVVPTKTPNFISLYPPATHITHNQIMILICGFRYIEQQFSDCN